jgi:hypothetical protein
MDKKNKKIKIISTIDHEMTDLISFTEDSSRLMGVDCYTETDGMHPEVRQIYESTFPKEDDNE